MERGFSLLLSEYVEAALIGYEDCKSFQIVCPSCKEPVFKVKRELGPSSTIHYLSHYEKDAAYNAACDLRVSSIAKEDIERVNRQSHNQRLLFFLSVLRDAVLNHEYHPVNQLLLTEFRRMKKSKGMAILREQLHEHILRNHEELVQNVEPFIAYYLQDNELVYKMFEKTPFLLNRQKCIAKDVWTHILSANVRDNFDLLFNNAFLFLIMRLELAASDRGFYEHERFLHPKMRELLHSNEREAIPICQELMAYPVGPPFAQEGMNLFLKLLAEVTHEMLGCLLRLPYFDILARQVAYRQFSGRTRGPHVAI